MPEKDLKRLKRAGVASESDAGSQKRQYQRQLLSYRGFEKNKTPCQTYPVKVNHLNGVSPTIFFSKTPCITGVYYRGCKIIFYVVLDDADESDTYEQWRIDHIRTIQTKKSTWSSGKISQAY
jgi:hypothetical protein